MTTNYKKILRNFNYIIKVTSLYNKFTLIIFINLINLINKNTIYNFIKISGNFLLNTTSRSVLITLGYKSSHNL